ncbi:hypothetical protein BDV95DRAFT_605669 [Massariosphaeria phaeospora]|uniref:Uncharacterized protein n=1 Tax=Massariosphaeria phaeospora TaxID=100035 RepID=A0A7C8ME66_9PLEO|nr:hypothetical protein BDV95DRAFT_605669 [Massariosphaeria phaeospora]
MATKQSAWKTLANYAKPHHDSVNAASATSYSPGTSPRPSLESRNPSTSTHASSSSSKSHPMSKAWKAVKKHAKEHHESLNTAYGIYYGGGRTPPSTFSSRAPTAVGSPRASFESERTEKEEEVVVRSETNARRAWNAVKQHAKEHHRSVNAAYRTTYGA